MIDFVLRPANPADLDALIALEEAVFDYDRLSRAQYRRHLRSPNAVLLVAVRGDALLGSALVFFRRGTRRARLYSLAVAPAARGLGLARRLLMAVEAAARRRGCNGLRLEVRTDNAAAIALYEKHGYRRTGLRTGYYDNGMDAACYEKPLPEGDSEVLPVS